MTNKSKNSSPGRCRNFVLTSEPVKFLVISTQARTQCAEETYHPGVLQVDVEVVVVEVDVDVVVPVVVVVSSKHPHQPGVSQVAVLVRVLDVVVLLLDVVVPSVLLLSYIFQFAQSRHSGVNLHSGTVSYFRITSLITDRILCVPIPTLQPLSPTVS